MTNIVLFVRQTCIYIFSSQANIDSRCLKKVNNFYFHYIIFLQSIFPQFLKLIIKIGKFHYPPLFLLIKGAIFFWALLAISKLFRTKIGLKKMLTFYLPFLWLSKGSNKKAVLNLISEFYITRLEKISTPYCNM